MNTKVIIIQNGLITKEEIDYAYANNIPCNHFRKVFFLNNDEIFYDWDDENFTLIDHFINNLNVCDYNIKVTSSKVIDSLLSSWDYGYLNKCTNKKDIIRFHLAWNLI